MKVAFGTTPWTVVLPFLTILFVNKSELWGRKPVAEFPAASMAELSLVGNFFAARFMPCLHACPDLRMQSSLRTQLAEVAFVGGGISRITPSCYWLRLVVCGLISGIRYERDHHFVDLVFCICTPTSTDQQGDAVADGVCWMAECGRS